MSLVKDFQGSPNPTYFVTLDLTGFQNVELFVDFIKPATGQVVETVHQSVFVKPHALIHLNNDGNIFGSDECYAIVRLTPLGKPYITIYEEKTGIATVQA